MDCNWRLRWLIPVALLAVALVACGGDDDDVSLSPTSDEEVLTVIEQTPSPSGTEAPVVTASPSEGTATAPETATPQADITTCPVDDDFCELADNVEAAMQAGHVDTILNLIAPAVVDCTAEPENPEGIDPAADLCKAHAGETSVPAYVMGARQSDAIGYIGAEELRAHLGEALSLALPGQMDEMGDGALRLYTVADESGAECGGCYAMVLSQVVAAEPAGYRRTLFELHVRATGDGGWQWGFLAEGPPMGNAQLLVGGDYNGTAYHYWSPEGVPAPPADGIYYGGGVVVTGTDGECLNVREEPATSGAIVTCLPPETLATVTDGPVEAEEFTWWQVESDGGQGVQRGWVAEDYIATFATDQQPSN